MMGHSSAKANKVAELFLAEEVSKFSAMAKEEIDSDKLNAYLKASKETSNAKSATNLEQPVRTSGDMSAESMVNLPLWDAAVYGVYEDIV